mgnify:CR=1 FL=1
MSLQRTVIIPITGQNTLVDPTDADQLRALIGDADNTAITEKEALRAEYELRWEAKKAELAQELADRDAFIKTKRDQLNAAHRKAIEKVRADAKKYTDAKDAEIVQLNQQHADALAAKDTAHATEIAEKNATIQNLEDRIAALVEAEIDAETVSP